MLATSLRRAVAARSVSAVLTKHATHRAVPLRSFSSEASSGIRRPKAIKVKKGDARRRVEPKPAPPQRNALVEQQEVSQPPAQYAQDPFTSPQAPQTFGEMMKQSFFWGIGMALAFTFVGVIASAMEEAEEAGMYDGSIVVSTSNGGEE